MIQAQRRSGPQRGDAVLDAALESMAAARREVQPRSWVGRPRRGIRKAYLARLEAAGILRADRGATLGIFPVTRWRTADPARVAQARARLDAVALSSGPVEVTQAAFAGLAHAVGLGALLYRGRGHMQARKRLEEIAAGDWMAGAVSAAASDQALADPLAGGAPIAADQAAMHAAHRAAVEAATAAAIHASVAAAHHAAAHDGGADMAAITERRITCGQAQQQEPEKPSPPSSRIRRPRKSSPCRLAQSGPVAPKRPCREGHLHHG